jgi:hypothetical protein
MPSVSGISKVAEGVYRVGGGWFVYQHGDQFLISPTNVGDKNEQPWPTQLTTIEAVASEVNDYLSSRS